MLLRINIRKSLTVLFILVFVLVSPITADSSKPKHVKLKKKLSKSPFFDHHDVYRTILGDTDVLDNQNLINQLLKIGRKKWLSEFIYPYNFGGKNPLEKPGLNQGLGLYMRVLSNIPNHRNGYHALELKMIIASQSTSEFVPLYKQIKKDPHTLRMVLKEGTKFKYRDVPHDELLMAGNRTNRVVYESYRFFRDELPKGIKNKLEKWSWEKVSKPKKSLFLTETAMAILLDLGVSEQKIESNFRFNKNSELGNKYPWTFKQIRSHTLQKAKKFRNEYPKWPINKEPKVDNTAGSESKHGKGH